METEDTHLKNYVTDYDDDTGATEGKIHRHESGDFSKSPFDFYYTDTKISNRTGGIVCHVFMTGTIRNQTVKQFLTLNSTYYVEAPTVAPGAFTSEWADWGPNDDENPVGVRPFETGDPISLRLGGTPDNKDFSDGITWTANVTAPPVIGGGQIAYNNQISNEVSRYIYHGKPDMKHKFEKLGFMLDTKFPYNNYFKNVDEELKSHDSPGTPLPQAATISHYTNIYYTRKDSFLTYLIYKPDGHEDHTIWVTLSVIGWGWAGTAEFNTSLNTQANTWEFGIGGKTGGGDGITISYLPEWDKNFKDYRGLEKIN